MTQAYAYSSLRPHIFYLIFGISSRVFPARVESALPPPSWKAILLRSEEGRTSRVSALRKKGEKQKKGEYGRKAIVREKRKKANPIFQQQLAKMRHRGKEKKYAKMISYELNVRNMRLKLEIHTCQKIKHITVQNTRIFSLCDFCSTFASTMRGKKTGAEET